MYGEGMREREEVVVKRRVQMHGSCRKVAAATVAGAQSLMGSSDVPLNLGQKVNLHPVALTTHVVPHFPALCLPGCGHSDGLWGHMGPSCLMPHGAMLMQYIPACMAACSG
jgi:hypothetical protein